MTHPPSDPYRLPVTRPLTPYLPQQQPPAPIPHASPVPSPSSAWAVWAFVVGLIGFLAGWCMLGIPCLAAVILGHVAMSDTRHNRKSGRGLAIAGLALGYVSLVPAIILFFWLFLGAGAVLLPGVVPSTTPAP